MTFGDYLKQKRETKDWTQPEAAAKASIEQSYLSKLETGKSYPSDEVFDRLVEAYQIDTAELADAVSSAELAKLREISAVRALLLDRDTKARHASRGWLLAGLAMFMLSGASFGFTGLGQDKYTEVSIYKSMGVLRPGETLETFDDLTRRMSGTNAAVEAFEKRKADLTDRIDEREITSPNGRGHSFVENNPDGRRYFELDRREQAGGPSPLRWFAVPAITFLFGALGCFLASFRWR